MYDDLDLLVSKFISSFLKSKRLKKYFKHILLEKTLYMAQINKACVFLVRNVKGVKKE